MKFKANDIVTWGSGSPRARIEGFDAELDDCGKVVFLASVVLTEDIAGLCGKVFPTGSWCDMPVSELRLV